MKTIDKYITEKLKIPKPKKKQYVPHTLFPKSKYELAGMIKKEIEENGDKCSLNHIDTSQIADMSFLFSRGAKFGLSNFNGDISEWDVYNVTDMHYMFSHSEFNGNIEDWDVSNVIDMRDMFNNALFNKDISNWKINPKCNVTNMFIYCPIKTKYKPKRSK